MPRTKELYSEKEEYTILKYIVQKKVYNELKGNQIWKDLQSTGLLNRSWQSMKEHFRKVMLPRLQSYKIRKRIVKRIRQGLCKGCIRKSREVNRENRNVGGNSEARVVEESEAEETLIINSSFVANDDSNIN